MISRLKKIWYIISDNKIEVSGQVAYTIKMDAHQYKDGKFKVGQFIDIYFRSLIIKQICF